MRKAEKIRRVRIIRGLKIYHNDVKAIAGARKKSYREAQVIYRQVRDIARWRSRREVTREQIIKESPRAAKIVEAARKAKEELRFPAEGGEYPQVFYVDLRDHLADPDQAGKGLVIETPFTTFRGKIDRAGEWLARYREMRNEGDAYFGEEFGGNTYWRINALMSIDKGPGTVRVWMGGRG